ncbi:MAG: acetyl-CoA carboxylase, carboxyltransferase subunit beta [Chitinophagales bacterium]|nr:acetyl-CoA carboxylase, carboxyltransferase subunit beta [Chitinophagales bacterium]MDW8428349.1 acetyl-CoA carboxylase, carboxyltransferase subunit beta [Chitinophagales bacterium]
MAWFKRTKEGITTSPEERLEVPEGIWWKCPGCKKTILSQDLRENTYVCTQCGYHPRINSTEYFEILFDENKYEKLFEELRPVDFLQFHDLKSYRQRLKETAEKTNVSEAITIAWGRLSGHTVVCGCMNFNFIGGSMGSVVGERVARAIDYCIERRLPLIIISKSGGARMMESAASLMQMAKTAAKLTQLAEARLPYFSVLTDPTTGGVTASFAMLGDVNLAEPEALIGFAGPRVIRETIKRDLPKGFQRSEFLLEHGFLDFIVNRKELKAKLTDLLHLFRPVL